MAAKKVTIVKRDDRKYVVTVGTTRLILTQLELERLHSCTAVYAYLD